MPAGETVLNHPLKGFATSGFSHQVTRTFLETSSCGNARKQERRRPDCWAFPTTRRLPIGSRNTTCDVMAHSCISPLTRRNTLMPRNENQTCRDLIEPALQAAVGPGREVLIGPGRVNLAGDSMYDEASRLSLTMCCVSRRCPWPFLKPRPRKNRQQMECSKAHVMRIVSGCVSLLPATASNTS